MKKIISILVVVVLLAIGVFAAIPASAATSVTVDWTKVDYVTYNDNAVQIANSSFESNFNLTKTADTLGANRTVANSTSYSYISTSQFSITSSTQYEYTVMVKTNETNKYGGVPFAINSSGQVYFAYGGFNNSNDTGGSWNPNKSYIITARGDFDYKYPSPSDELRDTKYFQSLQLDGGYASLKFVYNGLTVQVLAKNSSGSYVQMGYDVSLPTGSKLCFGIFSRDGDSGQNRTVTIKNAIITGKNAEAEGYMSAMDTTGRGELRALISQLESECIQADYTAASWTAFANALANAKVAVDEQNATADSIATAKDALEKAYFDLEIATLDLSILDAAIAKAEALNPVEYTTITYNMLSAALDEAKELRDAASAAGSTVKQAEVVAAADNIETKIRNLQPSGVSAETEPPTTEAPATEAPATEAPATEAPATEAPATEAPATMPPATEAPATMPPATEAPVTEAPVTAAPATESNDATNDTTTYKAGGCGGAVATTAVVIGLASVLGTALVIKKKED